MRLHYAYEPLAHADAEPSIIPGAASEFPRVIADQAEKLLEAAKAAGIVYQYDVDQLIWFEGKPSTALRKLVHEIKAVMGDSYRLI